MGTAEPSRKGRLRLPGPQSRRLQLAFVSAAVLLALLLAFAVGTALFGRGGKSALLGSREAAAAMARSSAEKSWRLESESTVSVIPANVVAVIDGGTAVFRLTDGAQEEVRLIGVGAPELGIQRDIYGVGSAKRAAALLHPDSRVFLEKGPDERDRSGRLLAYVWLTEPKTRPSAADVRDMMLNAKMLISGYAKLDTKPPNTRYSELFGVFLAEARAEKRGFWDPKLAEAAGASPLLAPTSATETAAISSPYLGNRSSMKFHRATCENAQKMRLSNRVLLESREAAIAGGYVPCKICKP